MRLSDIKGEEAFTVLADIMDPVIEIATDEEFKDAVLGGNKLGAVKIVMKNHSKSMLSIFAMLDRKDPKDYEISLPEIPMKVLDLINDPVFSQFFDSQGQSQEDASSGSATETTGATEKE